MNKVEFYKNMGQFKLKDTGVKINDILIYTKDEKEYTIHHVPTGARVASDKKLDKAKEKAFQLLESNKNILEERLKKIDLKSLPTEDELRNFECELVSILQVKQLPFEPFIYAIKKQLVIDFVSLDRIISNRNGYDNNLSLKDNIIKMYGEKTIQLLEKFKLVI